MNDLATEFKLTPKQAEAVKVCASALYVMLFGGSRSGKTFILVRNIIVRALKAPGSRHCILRFRFNHIKSSIIFDTFPKVMSLCFPDITYKLDKQDWYAKLPNGSEIWFGGLDDKERTDKILGNEYVTIYLNECSQISWHAVNTVKTRLAQKIMQFITVDAKAIGGMVQSILEPRMYFDCNPPNKLHWSYLTFVKRVDVDTKEYLKDADKYSQLQMNPKDNAENLPEDYVKTLEALPARYRKRFLDGEFADATPNALFTDEIIDTWRVGLTEKLLDFLRVIVAVDPSGSGDEDNADNDAIGVVVGAIGIDGNAYLLEDCTVKAGPATWGNIAVSAYERHAADLIVGEANYGGAMVQHVIRSCAPRVPFKIVTATRGKVVRAEPFSALYEQGKVRHVGVFRDLEDELTAFSTNGYIGAKSPNRADAWIWVLTELFPGLVRDKSRDNIEIQTMPKPSMPTMRPMAGNWMGR